MYIPDSVLKTIEKKPTDNDYIYGAEQMFKRLSSITEESYLCIDMSMLANTLELYYKGVLEASGLNIDPYLMEESHSLSRLYAEVSSRITPLGNESSRDEQREKNNFLKNISALYIDARYHNAYTSYEDFCKCRIFLNDQRERCMTLLDPSKAWNKEIKIIENNKLPHKEYVPTDDAKYKTDIDD